MACAQTLGLHQLCQVKNTYAFSLLFVQRLRRIVRVQSISVSYREIKYYFPEIS